jgi:pimeloyl-ACP methyl ester carboxylesterase
VRSSYLHFVRPLARAAGRGRHHVAPILLVCALATACSGSSSASFRASAPGTTGRPSSPSPTFTPGRLEALSKRCAFPEADAQTFWFRAKDGTMLDGAVLGSGSTGIVLAHQYPADLCGWWPYAVYLSRLGFRVMLFDTRCAGVSECPDGGRTKIVDDPAAAVAWLRTAGTEHVILVGASFGAVLALVTGGSIRPPLDGVVSLSGESDLTNTVGAPLDARDAVAHVRIPVLFMVARDDPAVTPAETRVMYARAGATDKRLVVLPGFYGHGWLMLTDAAGNPTRASRILASWLRAHAS